MKNLILSIFLLFFSQEYAFACPLMSFPGFRLSLVQNAELVLSGRLVANERTAITTIPPSKNRLHVRRFEMRIKDILSGNISAMPMGPAAPPFRFYGFPNSKKFENMALDGTYIAVLNKYKLPASGIRFADGEVNWASGAGFYTVVTSGCIRKPYLFPQISDEGRAVRLLLDGVSIPEIKSAVPNIWGMFNSQ